MTSSLVIILTIICERRQGTERNPAEDLNQDHDRRIQRDVVQLSWWSKNYNLWMISFNQSTYYSLSSNPISSSNNRYKLKIGTHLAYCAYNSNVVLVCFAQHLFLFLKDSRILKKNSKKILRISIGKPFTLLYLYFPRQPLLWLSK